MKVKQGSGMRDDVTVENLTDNSISTTTKGAVSQGEVAYHVQIPTRDFKETLSCLNAFKSGLKKSKPNRNMVGDEAISGCSEDPSAAVCIHVKDEKVALMVADQDKAIAFPLPTYGRVDGEFTLGLNKKRIRQLLSVTESYKICISKLLGGYLYFTNELNDEFSDLPLEAEPFPLIDPWAKRIAAAHNIGQINVRETLKAVKFCRTLCKPEFKNGENGNTPFFDILDDVTHINAENAYAVAHPGPTKFGALKGKFAVEVKYLPLLSSFLRKIKAGTLDVLTTDKHVFLATPDREAWLGLPLVEGNALPILEKLKIMESDRIMLNLQKNDILTAVNFCRSGASSMDSLIRFKRTDGVKQLTLSMPNVKKDVPDCEIKIPILKEGLVGGAEKDFEFYIVHRKFFKAVETVPGEEVQIEITYNDDLMMIRVCDPYNSRQRGIYLPMMRRV